MSDVFNVRMPDTSDVLNVRTPDSISGINVRSPNFTPLTYTSNKDFTTTKVGEYLSSRATYVRITNNTFTQAYIAFGPTVELAKEGVFQVVPVNAATIFPVTGRAMAWYADGPETLLVEQGT